MKTQQHRFWRSHRFSNGAVPHGTAATELAIILPVLMTFLLGCVDFGRVTFWSISISNAAATGCFYGATHRISTLNEERWETQICSIVHEELEENHGFEPDQFSCQVTKLTEADGNLLVTVKTNYTFKTIVNWPGLPHQIPISESVTMRQFK